MSGWGNLEGKNTRTVVENAKLRHPGHLGRDHVENRDADAEARESASVSVRESGYSCVRGLAVVHHVNTQCSHVARAAVVLDCMTIISTQPAPPTRIHASAFPDNSDKCCRGRALSGGATPDQFI
eukprot:4224586-Prymnesium_polylepis.1